MLIDFWNTIFFSWLIGTNEDKACILIQVVTSWLFVIIENETQLKLSIDQSGNFFKLFVGLKILNILKGILPHCLFFGYLMFYIFENQKNTVSWHSRNEISNFLTLKEAN